MRNSVASDHHFDAVLFPPFNGGGVAHDIPQLEEHEHPDRNEDGKGDGYVGNETDELLRRCIMQVALSSTEMSSCHTERSTKGTR